MNNEYYFCLWSELVIALSLAPKEAYQQNIFLSGGIGI
jgi:hypothetical protein